MTKWKMHGRMEIAATPTLPGVWKAKAGGWYARGRTTDPKTGKLREIGRHLPDVVEPAEALAWLRAELQRVRDGVVLPRPSRMRFAEYAASRLEDKVATGRIWSPKGRSKVADIIEHHLMDPFGPMWVDAITVADVEAWKRTVQAKINADELAPTTANTHLRVLRSLIGRVLPAVYDVESFDESGHVIYTEEEPNALLPEQVPPFLAEIRRHYPQHYAMVVVGFATGLRPSSLRGIRREGATPDLLWDQKILFVRRSVTRGEAVERTKTGLRQRLNVPDSLLAIFRWHVMRFNGPQQDTDLLFPSEVGGFRAESVLDKPFTRICTTLGIPRITARGMRRTFQDMARTADVDDKVTRSISGHASLKMQLHYSTIGAEEQRTAIGKVIELATERARLATA